MTDDEIRVHGAKAIMPMGATRTGLCGMQRDATGWVACDGAKVYEVQINGEWYGLCADCTAWCRAAYSGVTGVRQDPR